jgi:hypothetical protein
MLGPNLVTARDANRIRYFNPTSKEPILLTFVEQEASNVWAKSI